jgi:hypothetical protein
MTTVY